MINPFSNLTKKINAKLIISYYILILSMLTKHYVIYISMTCIKLITILNHSLMINRLAELPISLLVVYKNLSKVLITSYL